MSSDTEYVETLVIGGGQAGLAVGYHLARRDRPFLIVDAADRIGDAWRERWDSLRLFTPAKYDGLDGMPYPAPPYSFPTKDEMADYLEAYARHFRLPVRSGVRVERLTRGREARFRATCGECAYEADNVVVAMSGYQQPKRPSFAGDLAPDIMQLHSADYRNPGQLREGPLLLVGAGNSAAELARELAPHHEIFMSGRATGAIPFRIEGLFARLLGFRIVLRLLFHHLFTVGNPIGRRLRRTILHKGGPLIRVKPRDLTQAGVRRVPNTTGVVGGRPVLADGRVLDVANVIWCTGFHAGFDWIDLPVFGDGDPRQRSGIATDCPGLHFVGLSFLHALSSGMIQGVGRDAERIAEAIASGRRAPTAPADTLGARTS